MKSSYLGCIVVVGLAVLTLGHAPAASLAITPTIFTGAGAFNSTGRTLIAASGATSQATITALAGLTVIQDFTFTGNEVGNTNYVFDFTSGMNPDIRLRYTSGSNPSGVEVTNATYATSGSSSFRLASTTATTAFSLQIDFGTYDSGLGTFDANSGVQALAFTLSGNNFDKYSGVTVTYYDAANNLLSTQSLNPNVSGTLYGYTGYQSPGAAISYVQIGYTPTGTAPVLTLDDLSFVAVPEPGSVALLAVGLGAVALRCSARAGFRNRLV